MQVYCKYNKIFLNCYHLKLFVNDLFYEVYEKIFFFFIP